MLIVFSSHRTLTGFFVRLMTLSRWDHVDMLFDDGALIGALPKYVQKTTIETRERDKRINTIQVVRINLPDEGKARKFAEDQVGKPYDWGGCVGTVLRGSWQSEDKWFCSELVAKTCEEGGNRIVSPLKNVHRVTPARVEWAPQLELVIKHVFPRSKFWKLW